MILAMPKYQSETVHLTLISDQSYDFKINHISNPMTNRSTIFSVCNVCKVFMWTSRLSDLYLIFMVHWTIISFCGLVDFSDNIFVCLEGLTGFIWHEFISVVHWSMLSFHVLLFIVYERCIYVGQGAKNGWLLRE